MQNAHEDVKQIAKYIAPSNDDNGVIKIIKEVILNNKMVKGYKGSMVQR